MSHYLGLDISTTATKALLMDEQGAVVSVASATYDYQAPRQLWSEQDPAVWWDATVASIRQVLAAAAIPAAAVRAIGLSGQMHGLVLLDAAGRVLRPAILWNDQRTERQCADLARRVGADRLLGLTGNTPVTGLTAPKLLWVQQHEPEIFARIAHVLLPKDYVRYRLTGELASDVADGSGTLLMDLGRRRWSAEICQAIDVPLAWLPQLYEGPEVSGRLAADAAASVGLRAGTPVVAGGGDQAATAVGCGVIDAGTLALSLGTSGVIFAPTNAPVIEANGRLHAFCHAVPERWHVMGVMLSAAGSLRWFRDTFAPGSGYAPLLAPAARVPAGCEGLIFLPYLSGERTPYPDPQARGAFIGLTVRHTLAHLTRAVLEGVAFGLRDILELIAASGATPASASPPAPMRISGGGARSPLWRQIIADVLQAELAEVTTTEGAAFGAALLAAVGSGTFGSVAEAVAATVQITGTTAPGADGQRYAGAHAAYQELYPALKDLFPRLTPPDSQMG
jgi:xylulokinase